MDASEDDEEASVSGTHSLLTKGFCAYQKSPAENKMTLTNRDEISILDQQPPGTGMISKATGGHL